MGRWRFTMQTVDDRLIRRVGIPTFGLTIPHLTGLYGPHGPREGIFWVGTALFLGLAWMIWHANRWLLFKQQQHADWFAQPLRKLSMLLVGVMFGTIPPTVGVLWTWYALAGFPAPDWAAIRLVTLTNVICVVFVTHVYETVFLIKARERDLVEVERLSRSRAEAELEALKAQVDPHFLFNALNTLGWLIGHHPARAVAFNDALARVYRYILSSRGRNLVLLSEELEFLRDYLGLLAIRFDDGVRLVTSGQGHDQPDRRLLPPIALQVLVENAVKHNEFSRERPLELRLEVSGGALVVSNARRPRRDGAPSAGVGLRNLAERYRLATAHDIDVDAGPEVFRVRLPLLTA
jgi:hypothetical protein